MLGVAVLGLGRIGPTHARVVSQTDGVALKAVAEMDEAKLGSVVDGLSDVTGYGEYRDALARDDVQVVVICLPHWLHEQAAIDAAEAGKHIFIEKPLAISVAGCDRIIEAARRNNVTLMPAHTQRYYPVVARTKEILDSGELGELIMAVDTWYKPLKPDARPPWMLERKMGGGMALMDGVHLIDRMLWIFGADVESVSASVGNPVYPEVPADDTSMAFMRWRNGKVATVSRIAYRTGVTSYGADFFCTNGQVRFRIAYGGQGTTSVWVGKNEEYTEVDVPQFNSLERQFAEFVQALQEGREPPITAAHGRQVIEVMEAMDRSSETGREVLF
jgi:predicted dehydrogenase